MGYLIRNSFYFNGEELRKPQKDTIKYILFSVLLS